MKNRKLSLYIISGNAAFDDGYELQEMARILRAEAERLEMGMQPVHLALNDDNGNKVGRVHLEEVSPLLSDYLENPNHCPSCGSTSYEGGFIEVQGNTAYQKLSCTECDLVWVDTYKLSNVEVQDD